MPQYKRPSNPHRLRELERKVDHLTAENRKFTEQMWKLEVEREELLKHMKVTILTVQNVNDVVDISGHVW